MANKKKRKAAALDPVAAQAEAAPPAKRGRGRPSSTIKQQLDPATNAENAAPSSRGGRPHMVPNTTGQLTSTSSAQALSTPGKKPKPATTPLRSSKRLSDAATPISGHATRSAANGRPTSKVIAVKQTKGKSSSKAPLAPASEEVSVSKFTKARKGRPRKALMRGKAKSSKEAGSSVNSPYPTSNGSVLSVEVSIKDGSFSDDDGNADDEGPDDEPNYWLMKAEPESRIEKGMDVKFSIDDLRDAAEPEGWDGVRNPTARNNMRMMMKGDLAFFYHSNCKVPGIAGIMEIVQEHTPDESALDPSNPYYDPKASLENPKWCKVRVGFRHKFKTLIKLKELQIYAKDGGSLQHMQALRQSRLSVSKVTKREWDFIMSLVDEESEEEAARLSAPVAPMMETLNDLSGNMRSEAHDLLTNGLNAVHTAFEQAPDASNPASSLGQAAYPRHATAND